LGPPHAERPAHRGQPAGLRAPDRLGARGVARQYRRRTASMTSASVNIANRSASARRTAHTASYSSGPSASRSTADSARKGDVATTRLSVRCSNSG
jgi:hypothetical protein